jgi:protein unc-79
MWHQLSAKLVQFMAPQKPVRAPDVSLQLTIFTKSSNHLVLSFQPPPEDLYDEEKLARKSPPESEKENKGRDRDVSLSMAPLPIPLGPLGGFAGNMCLLGNCDFNVFFY